jgi:hypothetical protein
MAGRSRRRHCPGIQVFASHVFGGCAFLPVSLGPAGDCLEQTDRTCCIMPKDETTNEKLKAAMLKSLLALHPSDVAAYVRNVKDELDFDGREAAASSSV